MAKTRVYVTVDVECAEERIVGGRLRPPQGYDTRVWCRFRNQNEDLGIGLLMRELERFDLRGTFFVEAIGAHFFGMSGLEDVVSEMIARGHDVQLHTHPIQRNAAYLSKEDEPVSDDIAAYDIAGQTAILREGIDILVACGAPRESLVAFRAGNFGANADTWTAMKRAGLALSSNYNPCYFAKNCKMRHEGARAGLFEVEPGLWELPIANIAQPGGGHRHMQITAVSTDEIRDYLEAARVMGIHEACVVTHSFELCHIDSIEDRTGRPSAMNVHRLRELCRVIAESSNDVEIDTVGALGKRLMSGEETAKRATPREWPKGRRVHAAKRMVEQAYKRLEAKAHLR